MHWTQKKDVCGEMIRVVNKLIDSYQEVYVGARTSSVEEERQGMAKATATSNEFHRWSALAKIFACDECNTAIRNYLLASHSNPITAPTGQLADRRSRCSQNYSGRSSPRLEPTWGLSGHVGNTRTACNLVNPRHLARPIVRKSHVLIMAIINPDIRISKQ